ncbi:amidase family protein, partial [Paracoccus nototheniae]
MSRLNELTAAEMTDGFASGALSPVEVTRDVLAQIELCEGQLNSLWTVDPDIALTAASAAEDRWRRGAQIVVNGVSLDGVPVTIKENIATAGVAMPLGTTVSDMTPRPT